MGSFWNTKPPLGVQLDRSHPLTYGLVTAVFLQEGGGRSVTNSMNGRLIAATGTGIAWEGTPYGIGVRHTAGSYFSVPVTNTENTTHAVLWVPRSSVTTQTMSVMVEGGANDQRLGIDGSGNPYFSVFEGSGRTATDTTTTAALGVPLLLVGVSDLPALELRIYVSGLLKNTVFATGHYGGYSTPAIEVGSSTDGTMLFYLGWNRVLSGAEVRQLTDKPYAMLLDPVWSRYFVPQDVAPPSGYVSHLPLLGVS